MPNRPELKTATDSFDRVVSHKGIARVIRENKRTEAEIRNQATVPDKRRSFWRERGFTRQSQAASLVTSTVSEVNQQAKINKQRSEDWPIEHPAETLLRAIFTDQGNRAESIL
jgi:hypothetical protein